MDTMYLSSVLAAYRYRGFSEAAEALALSVSSVSKHVTAVENELGVQLFVRATKTDPLHPTEAGLQLLPRLEALMEEYTAISRRAQELAGSGSDRLIFALSPHLRLEGETRLLASFCVKHPEIAVQCEYLNAEEAIRQVRTGLADGCFVWVRDNYRGDPNKQAIHDMVKNQKFGCVEIARGKHLYLGMSLTHPLASQDVVSVQELTEETLIFNSASSIVPRLSASGAEILTVDGKMPRVIWMSYAMEAVILEMVRSSRMIVTSPSPRPAAGIHWARLKEWERQSRTVFLYPREHGTPALRRFKKFAEAYGKASAGED